jgi:hypothetical protein
MAAKVARRHALTFALLRAVLGGVAAALWPNLPWAQDTSFMSGEALAAALRQNLVWLEADDIGEHGYGVIVGGSPETLWIVTARHVVAKRAMLGLTVPDRVSQQIRVRFCALAANEKKLDRAAATPVVGWDSGGQDIALLSLCGCWAATTIARWFQRKARCAPAPTRLTTCASTSQPTWCKAAVQVPRCSVATASWA